MKPEIVKYYYETGELWREIYTDSNGNWHREDGPAYVWYFKSGQVEYESYYVNGKELTKKEVEELKRNQEINDYFKNMLKWKYY